MTVIIFILVLLVTVLVHEWGHFFAARKSGMLVEEFGFGIPPRIASWKKGATRYSLNALPIGGFVKIAGENGLDESIPASQQYDTKPWYLKAFVLVAGVVCNILLALLLFTIAYTVGMPAVTENGTPTVVSIAPNAPAEEAGIRVGDTITNLSIGSANAAAFTTDTIREAIQSSKEPVVLSFVHAGTEKTVVLEPKDEGGVRRIGIAIERIGVVKQPLGTALKSAGQHVLQLVVSIFLTLTQLIGGIFTHTSSTASLIGPVGLAREVGSAATIGFTYLLAFTAAISVNLAVLNILPFPALDGGRLLVVILEAIFRRRFSTKIIGLIHAAGFIVLIGLMLFLTVKDIGRLF
jgi:regulator of sigma E protease